MTELLKFFDANASIVRAASIVAAVVRYDPKTDIDILKATIEIDPIEIISPLLEKVLFREELRLSGEVVPIFNGTFKPCSESFDSKQELFIQIRPMQVRLFAEGEAILNARVSMRNLDPVLRAKYDRKQEMSVAALRLSFTVTEPTDEQILALVRRDTGLVVTISPKPIPTVKVTVEKKPVLKPKKEKEEATA